MNSYTKSLVMAVPAARRDVCNRLMEALKRGPDTFSVPLAVKGATEINAYGAHTYDDELAVAMETQALPPGVTLADLNAHGFSARQARDALGYIRYRITANREAVANFLARCEQDGVEIKTEAGAAA